MPSRPGGFSVTECLAGHMCGAQRALSAKQARCAAEKQSSASSRRNSRGPASWRRSMRSWSRAAHAAQSRTKLRSTGAVRHSAAAGLQGLCTAARLPRCFAATLGRAECDNPHTATIPHLDKVCCADSRRASAKKVQRRRSDCGVRRALDQEQWGRLLTERVRASKGAP